MVGFNGLQGGEVEVLVMFGGMVLLFVVGYDEDGLSVFLDVVVDVFVKNGFVIDSWGNFVVVIVQY